MARTRKSTRRKTTKKKSTVKKRKTTSKVSKKVKEKRKKRVRKVSDDDYKNENDLNEFFEEIREYADEKFSKGVDEDRAREKKPEEEKIRTKIRTVRPGDLVRIDYSITTTDGVIVDTSIGFEADRCGILDPDREYKPIEIIVGNGEVPKGVERALVGMKEGQTKVFVLEPEDGFGVVDKKKIKRYPIEALSINHKPIVGETIAVMREQDESMNNMGGEAQLGIIKKVTPRYVVIDFNHPLAGKKLVFSVKVIKVY